MNNAKKQLASIIIIIILIFTGYLLITTKGKSASLKNEKGDKMQIERKSFRLKKGIENIFDVPEKNTICTNSLDNALTLLKLNGNEIEYSTLAKDFLTYVSEGEFAFLPVFSNNLFCYVKQRMIVMFDIEKVKHSDHLICESFEESIVNTYVINGSTFLFKVELFDDDPANMSDPVYMLKKYQVDFNNARLLKEIELSPDESEILSGKNIFIHTEKNLKAFDLDFHPIEHPLATYINTDEKGKLLTIDGLVMHPELPFTILIDGKITYLIDWREDINCFPIFNDYLGLIEFSPDKKWLLYWQIEKGANKLYTMKINPESKTFLDLPVFLGEFRNIPSRNSMAWMLDPMSYVMIDEQKQELIVWRF